MRVNKTRTIGHEWCRLEVELRDGRLSICGSAGEVVRAPLARRMAVEYWESFFEDQPDELRSMNERMGTRFRSPRAAARFVLSTDGEYHGIDMDHEDGSRVYLTHSCGQIREELVRFFPDVQSYFQWHLNDMHAECVHQEARGETYTTHPGAECPDCGYKLGSAWTRRELPSDVIAWVQSLQGGKQ